MKREEKSPQLNLLGFTLFHVCMHLQLLVPLLCYILAFPQVSRKFLFILEGPLLFHYQLVYAQLLCEFLFQVLGSMILQVNTKLSHILVETDNKVSNRINHPNNGK
jgi:hypothetical protein